MSDKKQHDQKEARIPNISAHYYTDPIYGSSSIYGIDEYAEKEAGKAPKQDKDEALDEPVESWGWVNDANLD